MLTIFSTKVFTKCAQIELGFLLGLVVAHHNFFAVSHYANCNSIRGVGANSLIANSLIVFIIDYRLWGHPRISKIRRGTQLQWRQTRRTHTVAAAMEERRSRFEASHPQHHPQLRLITERQSEERESPIVLQWGV